MCNFRMSIPGQCATTFACLLSLPVRPATGAAYGITSDGFFQLRKLPQHCVVVGSGYIAVELAGVLHALGTKVTLVTRTDMILRTFEPVVTSALMERMASDGVQFEKNCTVASITKAGQGYEVATTTGHKLANVDCVLWAVGRKPNVDIGLERTGVELDATGHVKVGRLLLRSRGLCRCCPHPMRGHGQGRASTHL